MFHIYRIIFVCWSLCVLWVCNCQKPRITEHPRTKYGLKLQKTQIKCQASPPSANISWYKDGSLVESYLEKPVSSNRLVQKNTLTFLTLEKNDEGMYYCNASTRDGWVVSRNVSVKIAYLGSRIEGPQPRRVVSVGETLVLRCKPPRGEPPPSIAWTKDKASLPHSARVRVLPGGSLRIERVRRQDAGRYRCTARALTFARESMPGLLVVREKPRFAVMPRDVKVPVGTPLELPCVAHGDPAPSIEWARKGRPVPPSATLVKGGTALRIPRVSKDDGGRYICRAESSAGRMEAEVQVGVLVRPTFVETPSDTTMVEGSPVRLSCVARGSPTPSVVWSHYGDVFMRGDTGSRLQVASDGALIIKQSRPHDSGRYVCTASSYRGQVHTSAVLQVMPRTIGRIDLNTIPVIEVPPHNQTLTEGLTATFLCQPRRPKLVRITWLKDGLPLDDDPRIIILNNGPLKINQVRDSDSAKYTCQVQSDGSSREGTTHWDSFLEVVPHTGAPQTPTQQSPPLELLPLPPVQFEVVGRGSRYLMLSWKGATPLGALVQWHTPGRLAWGNTRVLHGPVPVRLDRLQPGTGYRLLLRAINRHGVSKATLLSGGIAYTLTPSTAGDNSKHDLDTLKKLLARLQLTKLKYKSVSRNGMTLEWNVGGSMEVRRSISGYEVRYQDVPLSRCIDQTRTNPPSKPLEHCSLKQIYLNSESAGSDTPSTLGSRLDTNIDLSSSSGEEKVKLVRNNIGDRNGMGRYEFPSDSMLILLTKLHPFQCYEVYVRPYTDHKKYGRITSSQIQSNTITVLTYDTEPSGAPRNLRATWVTNSSLRFDWTRPKPSLLNGVLTGYSLYVIGRITNNTRSIEVSPRSTHTIIRDLSRRHSYVIHMSARNCQGEGVRTSGLHIAANTPMGLVVELKQEDASRVYNQAGTPINRRRSFSDGQTDQDRSALVQQPWFISILIVGILLWVLVCSVVVMVCRGMYIRGLLYKSTGYSGGIKDANNYHGNGIGQPNSSTVTKDTVVIMTPLINNNSQTTDNNSNFYSNNHTTTTTTNNIEMNTNNHVKLNGISAVTNANSNQHHHQRRFMDSGTNSTSSNHSAVNAQNSNLMGQDQQNGIASSNVEPYATASLIQQQCAEQSSKDSATQSCYINNPAPNATNNHNSSSGMQQLECNGIPPPPSFPPPPAPPFSCSGSSGDEDDGNNHRGTMGIGNNGTAGVRDNGSHDDDGGSYASCPNDDEDDDEDDDRGLITNSDLHNGLNSAPATNPNFHGQICPQQPQQQYYWQPSQQNPHLHGNHPMMVPGNHQMMVPSNQNISQLPYQQPHNEVPPLIPLPVPGSWYMDYSCSPRLFPATTSASNSSSGGTSDMAGPMTHTGHMSHLFPPPPPAGMPQYMNSQ